MQAKTEHPSTKHLLQTSKEMEQLLQHPLRVRVDPPSLPACQPTPQIELFNQDGFQMATLKETHR